MSEKNWRRNGKKYDKRGRERHEGWTELFIDSGEYIMAHDYPLRKRSDRRKIRHSKIQLED